MWVTWYDLGWHHLMSLWLHPLNSCCCLWPSVVGHHRVTMQLMPFIWGKTKHHRTQTCINSRLIHPSLSRTMICQFPSAQCQDSPVLNEDYSNTCILSHSYSFLFFSSFRFGTKCKSLFLKWLRLPNKELLPVFKEVYRYMPLCNLG